MSLHHAFNRFEIVKLLIKRGADINCRSGRNDSYIVWLPKTTTDLKQYILLFIENGYKLTTTDFRKLLANNSDVFEYILDNIDPKHFSDKITEFLFDIIRHFNMNGKVSDIIKKCLKYVDSSYINDNRETLLHYVCGPAGSLVFIDCFQEIVKIFNGKANYRNKYGTTPLHLLLKNHGVKHIAYVEVLLEYVLDVDVEDDNFNTPLLTLVKSGIDYELQVKIIDLLIEKGCNIKQINDDRENVLHLASSIKLLIYLLKKTGLHINSNSKKGTPFERILQNAFGYSGSKIWDQNFYNNLNELIDMGVDISLNTIELMFDVKEFGADFIKVFEMLLQRTPAEYKKLTDFHQLIFTDKFKYSSDKTIYLDILTVLLEHGCNINITKNGKTFLEYACSNLKYTCSNIPYIDEAYLSKLLDIMLKYGFKIPTEDELNKITEIYIIHEKFGFKSTRQYVKEGDVTTALKKMKVKILSHNKDICSYTLFPEEASKTGQRACEKDSIIHLTCGHGYCAEHFFLKFDELGQNCSLYIGDDDDNDAKYCQSNASAGIYYNEK